VRDFDGQLVISHDLPDHTCITLDSFLVLYTKYASRPTLALNIKADGLQASLLNCLNLFGIENYFIFDMAVPDGLNYIRLGMNTYSRQSEYEAIPSYYEKANGLWLDEFHGHWISDEIIKQHMDNGKDVCIVSPELHKRSHELEWRHYRDLEKSIGKDRLMLCTDFPEQAKEFFNA
jgi:hypothetical protein